MFSRNRLLTALAGAVALAGVSVGSADAALPVSAHAFITQAAVPGSTITISIASILSNDHGKGLKLSQILKIDKPSLGFVRIDRTRGIISIHINSFATSSTGFLNLRYFITGAKPPGTGMANAFLRIPITAVSPI